MKPFQLILIAAFAIFAVIGLLVFAGAGNRGAQDSVGEVIIWGTLPQEQVRQALGTIRDNRDGFEEVTYFEVPFEDFGDTYTEALALNRGPDLILIPHELLVEEQETLVSISTNTISARDFEDLFIDVADIVRIDGGYAGIPIGVDPLIMYYNRSLFNQARVNEAPRFWEQFSALTPRFVEREGGVGLNQSFVALGAYENVRHAEKVLASFFFQVGSPIIDEAGRPALIGNAYRNVESALRFFTEFANPSTSTYSWNRGLREDRQAFLAQELALYLAPASEGPSLFAANPNLSIGTSAFPQLEQGTPVTYGSVYFIGISREAPNISGAQTIALSFVRRDEAATLVDATSITPIRRDLLGRVPEDSLLNLAYQEAFISQAWRSPQPETLDSIFSAMVESVVSGRSGAQEALSDAAREL